MPACTWILRACATLKSFVSLQKRSVTGSKKPAAAKADNSCLSPTLAIVCFVQPLAQVIAVLMAVQSTLLQVLDYTATNVTHWSALAAAS